MRAGLTDFASERGPITGQHGYPDELTLLVAFMAADRLAMIGQFSKL